MSHLSGGYYRAVGFELLLYVVILLTVGEVYVEASSFHGMAVLCCMGERV